MTYDSRPDTLKHIAVVEHNMNIFAEGLLERASRHDNSKLESPEKDGFDEMTTQLKSLTYGSEEYFAQLKKYSYVIEHHYEMNDHHPEHHANGIRGMNLLQIVEMFCDWHAACQRHDNGDIRESIRHNAKRFGYSDELIDIFLNSVEILEK